MSWQHLESGRLGGEDLELYEQSGVYMIRVGGLELMNGFCHDSEEEFALAGLKAIAAVTSPRVLIAGLGLGFTLHAALRRAPHAQIEVVERSAQVLAWYRKYFRPAASRDERVMFHEADVGAFLAEPRAYDLILMDVDNGPEPVVNNLNDGLYSAKSLANYYRALSANGVFALWSAFRSVEFENEAVRAGFQVEIKPVTLAQARIEHYLYLCRRGPM